MRILQFSDADSTVSPVLAATLSNTVFKQVVCGILKKKIQENNQQRNFWEVDVTSFDKLRKINEYTSKICGTTKKKTTNSWLEIALHWIHFVRDS